MRSLPLVLFQLPACSDPSGIYLLWFQAADDASCTENISENFKDGSVPEDDEDSPWTIDSEVVGADSLSFAQIVTTTGGDAVLLLGDAAFVGTSNGNVWTFTWTEESSTTDREEHEDGYLFTAASTSSVSTTLVWPGPADTTGTASFSTWVEDAWTESDEWGGSVAESIGYSGQIPSDDYVFEDTEYGWAGVDNDGEEDDCESETCELTVVTACGYDVAFDAYETTYEDEDAYAHLEDAGQ